MTALGILVVQSDWRPGAPALIDKTTYQHHGDSFQSGTRFLVYVREPVDAIVAEGEITGETFQKQSEAKTIALDPERTTSEHVQRSSTASPESGAPGAAESGIDLRTFEIPYQVVHTRIARPKLALGTIQARLGSDFSVFDEEWIPLTDEQYNTLTDEWERNKS